MVIAPRPMRDTSRPARCAFFMWGSLSRSVVFRQLLSPGGEKLLLEGVPAAHHCEGDTAGFRDSGRRPYGFARSRYRGSGDAEVWSRVAAQLASSRSASSAVDPAGALSRV